MEKLTLEHLAPYLPYGLRIQYKGIINGKELGIWNREQNKADLDLLDPPTRPMPEEIIGNKIGLIKKVETYKDYWKLRVGNGHKNIFPTDFGEDAFMLLRPLSDLTNEIEVNGEKFVPAIVFDYEKDYYYLLKNPFGYGMTFKDGLKLFKWHFDVFGLIDKGLAIDINTIKQ